MVRTGESYRSAVAIDRFIPGSCGWHLKEVTYLLDVKGYREKDFAYWSAVVPRVELLPQPQVGGEPSNGSAVRTGRADVWCWKETNHDYNPFVPVRCGDITNALKWSGQHAIALPVADRHSAGVAYARPESSSVEFNFHDLDPPPSEPTERPSQGRETATPSPDSLPLAAPPSIQVNNSPPQVRDRPTPATDVLPSPTNGRVGRAVNISIGESLEDVQTALGNSALLQPSRSTVHTNSQSLTLRDGVRVFFDESNRVYGIRLDAPFVGELGGREIIRTREALDRAPGARPNRSKRCQARREVRSYPISMHRPRCDTTSMRQAG